MFYKGLNMTLTPSVSALVNVIIFQLIWWLGVLQGNRILGLLVVLMACHFYLFPQRKRDFKLAVSGLLIGLMVDGSLWHYSLMEFAELPIWLGLLWSYLAVSLAYSLKPMQNWGLVLTMLVGGVAGGSSYFAGAKLGAVVIMPFSTLQTQLNEYSVDFIVEWARLLPFTPDSNIPVAVMISLIWTILFPLLLRMARIF